MSGPIRTITIDSNTPEPPNNSYYVTVTLPVWISDIPEGVTIEQVEKLLTVGRWDEGRYPFHEEMVHEGLSRMVKDAVREALDKLLREKFPDEMVPDEDGRGSMARWYLESQKIEGPYVGISASVRSAKIEQRCDECLGDGTVNERVEYGRISKTVTCPKCGGKGVEK